MSPLIVRRVSLHEAIHNVGHFGDWPTSCLRWCQAWSQSCADLLTFEVLLCERDTHLVGFAALYRVPRLELFRYLGHLPSRFNGWLRRRWRDPFTVCITYVDLPFADEEAVFIHPEESDPDSVRTALVTAALDDPEAQAVCIRATQGSGLAAVLTSLDLIAIDLPPGTQVDLQGGHPGWLARRSAKRRSKLRQTERTFAKAGGRIVRLANPGAHRQRLVELFNNTTQKAIDNGGIDVPAQLRPAFFDAIGELSDDVAVVLAAEIDHQIIGFLVLLAGPNSQALVGPCGLDYDKAPPARAYFALWPAAVVWASERGCETLAFGSEAYTYKTRLGAVHVPTHFHTRFNSRPLRAIAGPISRGLSAFLGRMEHE